MKTKFYSLLILILSCVVAMEANAQGCVAVRAMGGMNPLSTNGYTLPKGEFQMGVNYRYFHSWRHFVGTDEKPFRQTTQGGFANGKERGNAVNIYSNSIELNLSYALNDRLQFNLSVPYVHNERSQVLRIATEGQIEIEGEKVAHVSVGDRYSLYAQGLGDVRVSANYWVFDPVTASKGNLSLGLGVKLNTGSHSVKGEVPSLDKTTGKEVYTTTTMDQAIQPGDGGIGITVEVQGFRQLYKGIYGFVSGYYLFNPRESNGSFKSAPTEVKDEEGNTLGILTGYNVYASPDQYFARAGVMGAIGKMKNVTLSLAGRWEGIPAYDAFGGQVAYRRPGYVVAVEPGVSFRTGKHSIGLFVPFNFIRNRIQSAADIAQQNLRNSVITDESEKVHVQGDAAFADYSININYGYRLGKLF